MAEPVKYINGYGKTRWQPRLEDGRLLWVTPAWFDLKTYHWSREKPHGVTGVEPYLYRTKFWAEVAARKRELDLEYQEKSKFHRAE